MGNSKSVTFSPFLISHVCNLVSCLVHETYSLNLSWIELLTNYNPKMFLCNGLFPHKHFFLSSPQGKMRQKVIHIQMINMYKLYVLCLVWRRNLLHHYQMLQSNKVFWKVLRENFQLSRKFHIKILWYIFKFPFLLKEKSQQVKREWKFIV